MFLNKCCDTRQNTTTDNVLKIYFNFQDVLLAMKALGLNPGEQEMIDMTNEVAVNGLVYFPDFCKLVLRKYREDSKELLNQTFFKVNSKH